ncbi:MAG: hypothetical protein ACRDKH_01870 [Solirubrobacterales bacterium]
MADDEELNGELPAAEETIVERDDLLNAPGTYFNPQTEVLVIVDDSSSIDQEIFNMEAYEGVEWVRVSEDVPVEEEKRDELLERFQTHYHPGPAASLSETALEQGDGEHDEDEDGQDPGRED